MSQTLDNGAVVPINSDGYNLTADLAAMGNSLAVVTNVTTQTQRDALAKFNGRTVRRLDLPGYPLDVCNGTTWTPGDTGWITVPKQNGFTDYTATQNWAGLRYRVLNNVVHINGAATNASSWVANTVCGAIPSAYWPAARIQGFNVQVDPTAGYLILSPAGAAGTAISIFAEYPLS
jgi:hypothetical protein